MEYALSLMCCKQLGTQFAANGWSEQRIGDWLLEAGYTIDGTTAKRIQRAYEEQVARG